MLLSNRNDKFIVPHTSTCVIHTKGIIKDNDIITITSPIFSSTNFITKSINLSDRFDIIVHISSGTFVNDKEDGECFGTLVCDDNDVFRMYVKI